MGVFNLVGDAITGMIGQVTEIAGRAKQAFIVGQGLSPEGAKLLGKKLACMTIGDLEGLLEMKNIDPFKVIELMGHLKDLAKALVSKSRMNSIDFFKVKPKASESAWLNYVLNVISLFYF